MISPLPLETRCTQPEDLTVFSHKRIAFSSQRSLVADLKISSTIECWRGAGNTNVESEEKMQEARAHVQALKLHHIPQKRHLAWRHVTPTFTSASSDTFFYWVHYTDCLTCFGIVGMETTIVPGQSRNFSLGSQARASPARCGQSECQAKSPHKWRHKQPAV